MIQNLNLKSAIITDFRMKIYFRNIIVNIKSMPLLSTGGNISMGGVSVYGQKNGKIKSLYKDQPDETSITKNFSLTFQQAKINGKIVNTNILILHCARWPEKSAFTAEIIVDFSKKSEIVIDNPNIVGIYEGEYSYGIEGQQLSQTISGSITRGEDNK